MFPSLIASWFKCLNLVFVYLFCNISVHSPHQKLVAAIIAFLIHSPQHQTKCFKQCINKRQMGDRSPEQSKINALKHDVSYHNTIVFSSYAIVYIHFNSCPSPLPLSWFDPIPPPLPFPPHLFFPPSRKNLDETDIRRISICWNTWLYTNTHVAREIPNSYFWIRNRVWVWWYAAIGPDCESTGGRVVGGPRNDWWGFFYIDWDRFGMWIEKEKLKQWRRRGGEVGGCFVSSYA